MFQNHSNAWAISPKCSVHSCPSDLCLKLSSFPWGLVEVSGSIAQGCKGTVNEGFVVVIQGREGTMLCPNQGANKKWRLQHRAAILLTWYGTRCTPYKRGEKKNHSYSLIALSEWYQTLGDGATSPANTIYFPAMRSQDVWLPSNICHYFSYFLDGTEREEFRALLLHRETVFLSCVLAGKFVAIIFPPSAQLR